MTSVPVMSFHSVGDVGLPYDLRHLTTSVGVLERILKWLNRCGFATLTHQQLFDHLADGKPVPAKSVVLAFDDGYLDNWVFVHPLLKKYGQRGVIYVSGEFVEPSEGLRPTLEDVWAGKLKRDELPDLGYCNWAELRAMSEAGTLEVQSHLMSHSWHAVSDQVVGKHSPSEPRYWQAWNRDVPAKPFWLGWSRQELDARIPMDEPNYKSARSHTAPRCVIDETGAPQIESRAEFETRFEWECSESRRLIEQHIPSQKANFMAWPGGEYDARLQELALKHFDATFTTDLGVTQPGDDPTLVKRSFFAQRSPELMGWDYPSFLHFVGRLQRLRGRGAYRLHTFLAYRLIKLAERRKKK
ncbi:MAG: polysaccharide deacetylase family protein [Planctomycetes bacterium]|nr:polysaccharide deacetylase family protein [Planctomycetota bacterium]